MSKNDITSGAQYMPTPVGRWLYVWTPRGQKPALNRSRSCMISAHGEVALVTSSTPSPKGVELAFYCPNGYNLDRAKLVEAATGRYKPCEIIPGSKCQQDYALTKYQGYHGPGGKVTESYKNIQVDIHRQTREDKISSLYPLDKPGKGFNPEQWQAARQNALNDIHDVVYDIVTIRHRSLGKGPTLFSVIADLEAHGFQYSTVHCFFCRGYAWDKKAQDWQVGKL